MIRKDKFQFSLVIIILILVISILLFGWVYLMSLDNKFQSMIASPTLKNNSSTSQLEVKNQMLDEKVGELEKKLAKLENILTTKNNIAPKETLVVSTPKTKDIYIDSKCFENQEDLNQCQILSSLELDDNISIITKPISTITPDVNEISFEIYVNTKKITELNTTTVNLLDTSNPIATITYLNSRDITINTNVGISNVYKTYHYDGLGWIDYSKYSSN